MKAGPPKSHVRMCWPSTGYIFNDARSPADMIYPPSRFVGRRIARPMVISVSGRVVGGYKYCSSQVLASRTFLVDCHISAKIRPSAHVFLTGT